MDSGSKAQAEVCCRGYFSVNCVDEEQVSLPGMENDFLLSAQTGEIAVADIK